MYRQHGSIFKTQIDKKQLLGEMCMSLPFLFLGNLCNFMVKLDKKTTEKLFEKSKGYLILPNKVRIINTRW